MRSTSDSSELKAAAFRDVDRADIRALSQHNPRIDPVVVLSRFELIGELLGAPDRAAEIAKLLAR